MRSRRTQCLVIAFLMLVGSHPHSQTHPIHRIPSVPDELLNRPLVLRSGIGLAHDTVATSSKDAQAFYDQGLA